MDLCKHTMIDFALYFIFEFKFKVTWMDINVPVSESWGVSMQMGFAIII